MTAVDSTQEPRRRRTGLIVTIIVVVVVLIAGGVTWGVLAANGSGSSSDDTSVAVGLRLEPTNLDIVETSGIALDQVLIDNVYEALLSRDDTGTITDAIASSHKVSKDGLTYTFTIRDGVKFHDGKTLKPSDVVWSLERIKDDDKANAHLELAAVDTIKADGQDVVLTLSEPSSTLLWSLTGRAGVVLEKAATNDIQTTANGTGPYRLTSWKQGDSITLSRFDDYWGDKAGVAKVVFQYFTDSSAEVNAVLSGDLQVATGVDPTLIDQLKSAKGYDLVKGKTTDKFTLAFNNAKAPFTDIRVRQAIRQAIDPKALIASFGAGVPLGGPIPEGDPGYEDLTDIDSYNPENAKKLLAEAGVPNLALTVTIASFYGTTITDVLTSELKDVGITLTVKPVEFATWLSDVYTAHDYDLSIVDHAESRDFGSWANPKYYFGYDNPQVQKLYQESQTATSESEAADKLKAAAKIVSEDAAAEWLFTSTSTTAVDDTVKGFPTDFTSARLNLKKLAVTE